ncbi:MAG: hypothetical protein NZM10_03665 [Fimbriimonadales bacterium]|nr:hypothetical protein [Fimbriimonadales bacterium]
MRLLTALPGVSVFCILMPLVGASDAVFAQSTTSKGDPHASSYYDERERVASTRTFVWTAEQTVSFSAELVHSVNTMLINQATRIGTPLDKVSLIDESIIDKPFLLSSSYTVERLPERVRFRVHKQIPAPQFPNAAEQSLFDLYVQGSNIIHVSRSQDGTPTSVHLAATERDPLGIGCITDSLSPELMVILAGASPFRLYGSQPSEWRIREVTPNAWVFSLEKTTQGTPTYPKVEMHLSRSHGDALALLTIQFSDTKIHVWRTTKYKYISSAWFPSEIDYSASGVQPTKARYVLTEVYRSRPFTIDIPDGTPVFDWRRAGDAAWNGSDEYNETLWKPDILSLSPQQKL